MYADIVKLLVDHGADIAAHDENRWTPLHLAAYCGGAVSETVQLLLECGADATARDRSNKTPLHLALSKVISSSVSLLIQHRRNMNAQRDLYFQLPNGKARTVRLLIEHGADVNAQDETHTTPLHLASFLGTIPEIVQLLIECGADITAKDWKHRTPLHMVSSWVSAKKVTLSIQHMAEVNG